jgi:site-specific recombinase XerD
MNSRISYRFILKPITNKQGLNPIYIRAFLHGQKSEIATSVAVATTHWDEKLQRVRRTNPAHEQFNTIIDLFEKKALKYILSNFIHGEVAPTLTQFKAYMTDTAATPNDWFGDYIMQYLNDNRTRLSASCFESYKSQITKLLKFKKTITFADIDEHFINKYREYMLEQLHNCENTVGKSLRTLRTFINIAERRGVIKQNPFKYISIKRVEGQRDCLTREELSRLDELYHSNAINNRHERRVLQYFLFACYTGLRYSDLKALTKNDIKENTLVVKMHKTGLTVGVPLSERAQRVLESDSHSLRTEQGEEGIKDKKIKDKKINDKRGKGKATRDIENLRLFQVYCNKTTNKTLQSIGKRYAIGRHLTCHVARHTFATVSLQLGIPIEVVSKLLGHTNLRTTQIYAKIVDEVKVREMRKWNNC